MRHVSRLKSFFWYTAVGMLVTVAVLVSLARLTVSSVSEYRSWFEQRAGDYLGQPVSIGSMDARLVGLKPSILLQEVALRAAADGEPLAQFEQISIALNPLTSLRQLTPIMDLTVTGADLVVIQHADDSFTLQGARFASPTGQASAGGGLEQWFLSQARLSLEQSRITWYDEKHDRRFLFDAANVELQNLSSRHRLNAAVNLPEELGTALRLSLDIQGSLLNRRDWVGDIYLKAEQIRPAYWLSDNQIDGLNLEQGSVDMELWSHWQDGQLLGIEGELALKDVSLRDLHGQLELAQLAGQFQFTREQKDWQLQVRQGRLHTVVPSKPAAPFSLQLQQRGDALSLQLLDFDVAPLERLAAHLPWLDEGQRQRLSVLRPSGQVESLRLELDKGQVRALQAAVRELELAPLESFPGVAGLQAQLVYDGERARLALDSEALSVSLPRLFAAPLPPQQVRGTLLAGREEGGWRVVSEGLAVESQDLTLQLALALQWQPNDKPLLTLLGTIGGARAEAVPDYLPVKIMSGGTVEWLNSAFAGGQVTGGSVLLHGPLEKGMLRNERGRFEVRFAARDVALNYRQGWPRLDAIDAEALFTGQGMDILASSARFYRSAVEPTRVRIRNFREPVLELQGSVAASAGDALRFLRESPLADAADDALARMQGEGMTPLDISLSAPLASRLRQSRPLRVEGVVRFSGNRLQLIDGIAMEQVEGTLNFSEKAFSATNIAAQMYGHPARVDVFTETAGPSAHAPTVVALRGHASADALQQAFPLKLLRQLEGESDWQARLSLTPGEQGGAELDLYSSLMGMAVALPAPLDKTAELNRPLVVSLGLAGHRSGHHVAHYGSLLELHLQQQGPGGPLQRMALQFSSGTPVQLPELAVISISGSLEGLDWSAWRELLQEEGIGGGSQPELPLVMNMKRLELLRPAGAGGGAVGPLVSSLPQLDFHVEDLTVHGMALGDVTLKLVPETGGGRIDEVTVKAPHLNLSGEGRWDERSGTEMKLKISSPDLGEMLQQLGFASVISEGKTRGKMDLSWPGTPLDYSLATVTAKGSIRIEEGAIREVKPGAGKLLGLLSLQALPRRLFLDFSDLSEEGLRFSSIEGDIKLSDGNAFTSNLLLNALPADVLISGRTGLVTKDFDQLVIVVPKVSDTVSVAGALAWGPQVAAALIVLQKIFQRDIDAATMTRYKVTGSWEKPEITRLDDPVQVEDES